MSTSFPSTDELVRIGADLGIEVRIVDEAELERLGTDREWETNHSSCAGDEVWIGFYDDDELRTISFFHEIGHMLEPPHLYDAASASDDTDWEQFGLMREMLAWMRGLEEAHRRGISFSPDALTWATQQWASYVPTAKRRWLRELGHEEEEIVIRDLPDAEAKSEILAYMRSRPEADLSNILFDLKIDIGQAGRLCDALRDEGKIEWADE